MERLTKRGKNGGVYFPEELVGVTLTPDNATIHRLLWRLAAYEDVGLEPAEVISMQGEWRAMMAALNSIGGGYGRLRELAKAIDSAEERLRLYRETGNTEWLVDLANFAMIEYMHHSHPQAHFRATGGNESPGLKNGISYKELMEEGET